MAERYDPVAVETKWQKGWDETRLNNVDIDGAANPFYNLMMYPYPSAEGLQAGVFWGATSAKRTAFYL